VVELEAVLSDDGLAVIEREDHISGLEAAEVKREDITSTWDEG